MAKKEEAKQPQTEEKKTTPDHQRMAALTEEEKLFLEKGRLMTDMEIATSGLEVVNARIKQVVGGRLREEAIAKMPKKPPTYPPYELYGDLPDDHPENPKNWAADHAGHEYFEKFPDKKALCKAFKKEGAVKEK